MYIIKIPAEFFAEINDLILKFTWKFEGLKIVKKILKRTIFEDSHFKAYYEITVIKTVLYWYKDRHTVQWNRRESPRINPLIYDQLIFDTGAKTIQ